MKLFRKDTDYAVQTLVYLAQHVDKKTISSTVIATELGIPKTFLRRIFSTLVKGGYLEAAEGINGGVRLIKQPVSMTVFEIILLFQQELKICNCSIRNKLCLQQNRCVLRRRILQIENLVAREFQKITIQTLVDDVINLEK